MLDFKERKKNKFKFSYRISISIINLLSYSIYIYINQLCIFLQLMVPGALTSTKNKNDKNHLHVVCSQNLHNSIDAARCRVSVKTINSTS